MTSSEQPQNTDISAERAVLSAIMHHNIEAIIKTEDISLRPTDFFYETNSAVFAAMMAFYESKPNGKIDKFSILEHVKAFGSSRIVTMLEDNDYIEALSSSNVGLDSVDGLAMSVKKNSVFRSVINGLESVRDEVEEAIEPKFSLEDLMCLVENKYNIIVEGISNPNAKFQRFGDTFAEWVEDLVDNPCDYAGIPTGFPLYDYSIGRGFRRGSVNMLGARTGIGKSMLSLNFGNNIANSNIPVLYIDTELTKELQLSRLAAARTGIGIYEIETGRFARNPEQLKRVRREVKELEKLNFYHQYVGGWRFEEILSYMKKWVRQVVGVDENGVTKNCVIIFDYMKMMRTEGLNAMKEYQLIGFWCTMLHDFSIRYDVPLFLLIQLNRDGIQNEGQGVAAQSDRTEWLASSFTIFKNKTEDELAESGSEGNSKLIVVKSRYGPSTPGGDWINIRADRSRGSISEGRMQSAARRDAQPDNEEDDDED